MKAKSMKGTSKSTAAMKKFEAMVGSGIHAADAAKIGPLLEKFEKLGQLTPEFLVKEAERKNSPFHKFFEWDNGRAAHKHRIEQARFLIRSVRVVIVEPPSTQSTKQRTMTVKTNAPKVPPKHLPTASSTPSRAGDNDMREYLIEECKRDARFMRSKYAGLSHIIECKDLFDAIDALLREPTRQLLKQKPSPKVRAA